MSELTQRLRELADEELTTTTCFLAFGELSDNGRIHEQRYRDLLAAAEALEWKPISEAPKDGTVILLAHGGSVYPGRWHNDGTKWPWKVMDSDGEMNGIMHGSHGPRRFLPIPAPPEVKP